jgi:hypothetical protein
VLASLLPGLREVRAPLAAGFLWIAFAWVLFEPIIPERDEAEGVVASFYRATDLPSVLGIGVVVLSFAAYLIGELTSNTLGPVLRRHFPPAWRGQGKDWPRTPLSQPARDALLHVARRSHDQLKTSLALSGAGMNPGEFLEKQLGRPLPPEGLSSSRPTAPAPNATRSAIASSRARRLARGKSQPSPQTSASASSKRMRAPTGPGSAEPPEPRDENPRQIALMVQTVLEDLDVVAKTRLLGRDPELYAEVDRNRAAVEFDLAIAPPLLALAIGVGARSSPLVFALLLLLGALLSWGLFRDAVRSEKVGTQLLLQSIEDRRVYVPALERLETAAAALASRQQPDSMRGAAAEAALALQGAMDSLEDVGSSEPALARHARRQIDLAQEPMARVSEFFPAPVVRTAEDAMGLLTAAADGWVAATDGFGPPKEDPQDLVARARERITTFRREAREAVQQATTLGGPPSDRPGPDR